MNDITLGLLGKNLIHSKSKTIYEEILKKKINYTFFDFEKEEDIPPLDRIFKGLQGLSITSPYKEHFFSCVQKDKVSQELGAINCIKKSNNKYLATITDYYAVKEIFCSLNTTHSISKSFILGDGVMSRISQYVMKQSKIPFQIFSRKKTKNFHKLDLKNILGQKNLIINSCSRDYSYTGSLNTKSIFWDYNYNFDKHNHIKLSLKKNYIDGLGLLYIQAKYAVNFWNINTKEKKS